MAGREELPVTYRTRMVETLGLSLRIVTQPDFDTCPLVAICNALLLRNFSFLEPSAEEVSREDLLNLVGNAVVDLNSGVKNESAEQAIIRKQNINVYLEQLRLLARQADMVVRSTRIDDFEHTPILEICNHLKVGPYHGWVVDPQAPMAFCDEERNSIFQGGHTVDSAAGTGVASPDFAKGSDSHDSSHSSVKRRRGDELESKDVERAMKDSLDPPSSYIDWSDTYVPSGSENSEGEVDGDSVSLSSKDKSENSQQLELSKQSAQIASDSCNYEEIELLNGQDELPVSIDGEDYGLDSAGKVVEDSLENIGNQLTVYGLDCLKKEIREKDPRVFFCNNRFSTIVKFNDELYLLATGEEYINKPDFVWMKLDEMYRVKSDRVLMTGKFEETLVGQENSSPPDVSSLSLDIQRALVLQGSANEGNP